MSEERAGEAEPGAPPARAASGARRAALARAGYALALAGLCVLALRARLPGLDPPSLWVDDQWVALAAREMGAEAFARIAPAVPAALHGLLRSAAALGSDPEWPLQLPPLLASVAAVPLAAELVRRGTGFMPLGLLGGALAASDPVVAAYAVRVKPYALDAAASAALLAGALPLLARPTRRAFALYGAGAFAALLLSFPAALVGAAALHLAAAFALWERRSGAAGVLGPLLAFDAAIALLYAGLLRHQSSEALLRFWSDAFLPGHDPAAALRFLATEAPKSLAWALPGPLQAGGWLMLPGAAVLAGLRETRRLAALAGALLAGALALSALGLYPLGTGRTDCFLHPLAWLLVCAALAPLARLRRGRRAAGAALVAGAAALGLGAIPESRYPEVEDARLVREASGRLGEPDALLVSPHAHWAAAYYGPWPLALRPSSRMGSGYAVSIERPRTRLLEKRPGFRRRPALLDEQLRAFLREAPPRIVSLSLHESPEVARHVEAALEGDGYVRRERLYAPRAALRIYERPSAPGEAGASSSSSSPSRKRSR